MEGNRLKKRGLDVVIGYVEPHARSETTGEAPRIITAEAQRAIGETLETAQRMGGIVTVLKRDEVAAALIDFAREYGITHCVVGRPSERPFWQRLRLSLHEKLLQELEGVDLVVV